MRSPAAALGLVVLAGAARTRAEPFHYVDRDGREHVVTADRPAVQRVDPGTLSAGGVATASPGAPSAETTEEAFPFAPLVDEAARLYLLPPELVRAVIRVESGYQPHAVSSAGALGLMQLMPATAAELGVVDPFDPRQNVLGGARLLRILVNAFDGDVTLAIAAYHAGAGCVRRAGGVPPIVKTRQYVRMVLATFHRLRDESLARARAPLASRR